MIPPPVTLKDRALNALMAWESARSELATLKAERNSHRCEVADEAEPEVGYVGTPECWREGDDFRDGCDPCKVRQALMPSIRAKSRELSQKKQRMQRAAASLLRVED